MGVFLCNGIKRGFIFLLFALYFSVYCGVGVGTTYRKAWVSFARNNSKVCVNSSLLTRKALVVPCATLLTN